jgi:hypothetical protein
MVHTWSSGGNGMKLFIKDQPRIFHVSDVSMKDYGKVFLESNEMIALITNDGKECDIAAKEWGFYLTPSINVRLREQGFKVALVKNKEGKLFINAVEKDKMELFETYLVDNQTSSIICWLDEWLEKDHDNRNKEI